MDFSSNEALRKRLMPGERLLWSGRPRRGIVLTMIDWFQIPFSIVWCAFVWLLLVRPIYLYATSVTPGAPPDIIEIPAAAVFTLAGAYFTVGRFIVNMVYRERTVYGLTDKRALIHGGLLARTTSSLDLASLANLNLIQHRDGRGTVMLGDARSPFMFGHHNPWHAAFSASPRWFQIVDAQRVFAMLQETAARARAGH